MVDSIIDGPPGEAMNEMAEINSAIQEACRLRGREVAVHTAR